MAVHGDHHLVRRDAELMGRAVDDPLVGLVRYKPVDIGRAGAGGLEGVVDHVGDHRDRMLEHVAAFHAQMADGLGRGRSAVHIELALEAAVRAQVGGQNPAVGCSAGLRLHLQHQGAGAVAEQHAGGAVVPVQDTREGLRPDHQRALETAAFEQRVDDRQRIDEARTNRLQIEGGAMGDAEAGLHRHRGGGKSLVRRRGGEHDQVDRARLDMGIDERRARGMQREVGGQFAGGRDMAFADTGALHDPFVGGFHRLCQLIVAEDARGQIAAATEHHRTQ